MIDSSIGPAGLANRDSNDIIPRCLLFVVGFASSSAQFILLREASILGGGSEITTGIYLWLWLMISSPGAISAAKIKARSLKSIMLIFISGLVISVLLYFVTSSLILKPGEIPSFIKTLVIISITVAPATFVSSFTFIRLTAVRQITGNHQPGNSFGTETAGSVAAGVLTTLFLSACIANFQTYFIVIIIVSLTVVTLLNKSLLLKITAWILGLSLLIFLFIFNPENLLRGILLKGVHVEKSVDTRYGNITTGIYGGEETVFYDHRPLFYSGDVVSTEEDMHYALLQREEHNRILIISGGIMRHLSQVRKYEISEVVYVEHDPRIADIEKANNIPSYRPDLRIVRTDPIRHLRMDTSLYDAIIQLLPPPSTLSLNRYYTLEYFETIKTHLSDSGVFAFKPLPYYKYSPESYRKSFSPIYNSLKKVFGHIVIIPGSQLYVIASDYPLSDDITQLAEERGIVNEYVNGHYLNDEDIKHNGDMIIAQVDPSSGLNTALKPVSTWFNNSHELELRGVRVSAMTIIVLLILIPFLFIRRGGFIMFSASAGLAGYGMIMVFILQVVIGSIYLLTPVILTLLMAGLAVGSSKNFCAVRRPLLILPCCLAVVYSITGVFAGQLLRSEPMSVMAIVSVCLILSGYLTGNIYRVMTADAGNSITGRIYASDLAGAALGYMVVSAVLVPLVGISYASLILAALILTSVALVSVIFKR